MKFIELVPGKVLYAMGQKIASRTVLGYLFYLKYGDFKTNNPRREVNQQISRSKEISDNIQRLSQEYVNYPVRICIVRDPVDRFISAFLSKANNNDGEAPVTLDYIIENMNNSASMDNSAFIYNHNRFLGHTIPQVDMFGTDPSVYTHIFNINQMDQVKALVETQAGVTLPNLHLNKSCKEQKITDTQREWIKNRYQNDYTVYGKWM